MAIKLYSGLTPAGDYPLIEAKDVEMPDGTRLSEFKGGSGVPADFFEEISGGKWIEKVSVEDLTFAQNDAFYGLFIGQVQANMDTYNQWISDTAAVKVVWDGVEYICQKQYVEGMIAVGNLNAVGGTSNNEPFVIFMAQMVSGTESAAYWMLASYVDTEPLAHDVQVFFAGTKTVINSDYLPEISGSAEIPVFDLAAMGLPAVPVGGGSVQVSTDATALFEALNQGAVTFAIPCDMNGMTMTGYCTVFSFTDGASMHQCIGAVYLSELSYIIIEIYADLIVVNAKPFNSLVDEYIGNALGGDY